ncbi:MAG: restriction endonuclease [Paramuribaculum sp.]|nr:restriction endonuclease [Paramuribaculum sp.]
MIPTYQECMLPLLRLLKEKGTLSLSECTNILSEKFRLTPHERNELLPSKKQTIIKNRVGWAKFYLDKAGLLEVPSRGNYALTDNGLRFLDDNPSSLTTEDLMSFPAFKNFITNNKEAEKSLTTQSAIQDIPTKTPEEIIDENFKYIIHNLVDEVLGLVLQKDSDFFERLVMDLLVQMGYGDGRVTRRSRDGGIDGIIDEDKLGLEKIYIQAKRWQPGNNVGRSEVESFVGAIDRQRGNKGVFITTSDFTREAYEHTSTHVNLVKINGRKLAELMIQYNIGATIKNIYEIKKIDLDYFDEA